MSSTRAFLEQLARGLVKIPTAMKNVAAALVGEILLIILDCSGSMASPCGSISRLGAAQDAVIALLDVRRNQSVDDSVAIVAFKEEARLVLPVVSYRQRSRQVQRAVRSLTARGGTDLASPLRLAEEILPTGGRLHVVFLSDGQGGDPSNEAGRLKRAGVIIDTIGVGNTPAEVDEQVLKATASVLHGKVLYRFIRDAGELSRYFRTEIANRLVKRSEP